MSSMHTIKVELDIEEKPSRSYPIFIERGLISKVGETMIGVLPGGRCAVVTNPTVGDLYLAPVIESLKKAGFDAITIEIPDGEEYKNLTQVSFIYDRLLEARLERDSAIIALGGGVIGDISGFVAATYLRGVPFVQAPTTLLAFVDSSVGGKTGVNHRLGKNMIGAFYQPKAVIIDPDALFTLDKRELMAGFSEVVKYGVIRDAGFFKFMEDNAAAMSKPGEPLIEAIKRSCAIKAEVVMKDERESGIRSILNFGHTFAHAIEALTGYKEFRHGEAVSIGMVMAARLSHVLGLASKDIAIRLEKLLKRFSLPVKPPGFSPYEYVEAMKLDKKVKAGNIRFVLVEDLGRVIMREVPEKKLIEFIGDYTNFEGSTANSH
ncbi:MAG: 3-dehydroquinate synthase [Thermodesulfobacteriota bacterium]